MLSILFDYVRLIGRRWWLVAAPLVLVAVYSIATRPAPVTTYQVVMRFAVGLPPERVAGVYNFDRHYDWLASEYFTQGLSNIIGTNVFAESVARRLPAGLAVSAAQIQGALRSDYKASLMVVYLTWPDPAQAAQIAEAVDAQLRDGSAEIWPQLTGADAAPVRLLDKPNPIPMSIDLRSRFDLPVRLALAAAAGVVLAFIGHALDRMIREPRDVERLGLLVLGRVPKQ